MYYIIGTKALVTNYEDLAVLVDTAEEHKETKTECNKDTGEKKTMQKWTRGMWFCVGGAGHIYSWHPLYQSVLLLYISYIRLFMF